jgi:cysteine desulfurase
MNIDLLSISGHKIYGPKGIGALYIRRKPRVRILPLFNGGGQERGLRSGTLAPALIVGLGKACEVAKREMKNDHDHVTRLYNKILKKVRENITHCQLNGDENQRYMGNLNLSFAYVEGESLLMALKKYAVSSGSACTSESLEPSYVLRAVGVSEDLAHTSLRIGLGRFTLESEVDEFLAELEKAIVKLRELSPLWEMVNEGVDISAINWSQPH